MLRYFLSIWTILLMKALTSLCTIELFTRVIEAGGVYRFTSCRIRIRLTDGKYVGPHYVLINGNDIRRYGREEILALYDRNVKPPAELKLFDALYNPRGKPPLALNTTFEEDMVIQCYFNIVIFIRSCVVSGRKKHSRKVNVVYIVDDDSKLL